MGFSMKKYKELIDLSDLKDMDSYHSKEEMEEFFNKVFADDIALKEGLERVKELGHNFLLELITDGTILDEDVEQKNQSIVKLFPFYDLEDMLTVKILYLSIKYFYPNSFKASYKLYENPDYIEITLNIK